jgi:riboflavin synthase
MFTGLIETLASVHRIQPDGNGGRRLWLALPQIIGELTLGESVCINGACLTVVEKDSETCLFQVSPETLARTNLGHLESGDRVNVERSLRVSDRLGGHIVQGHVDGLGHIAERKPQGEWETIWFACPRELIAQMVAKGSVAVDGVSLTLVEVLENCFSVSLIPHTLANTTLGFKQPGAAVNLETDLFGKYIIKYMAGLALRPSPSVR